MNMALATGAAPNSERIAETSTAKGTNEDGRPKAVSPAPEPQHETPKNLKVKGTGNNSSSKDSAASNSSNPEGWEGVPWTPAIVSLPNG